MRAGCERFLKDIYLPGKFGNATYNVAAFVSRLKKGDAEGFMEPLDWLFRMGDYSVVGEQEKYYQNVLRRLFLLMGGRTAVEYRTASGHIDLLVRLPKYVYLFELKMEGDVERALRQIEEKDYAGGVELRGRRLIKIGVTFAREGNVIKEWKVRDN